MNPRDRRALREIIRLCDVGANLVARGHDWYMSDPDGVPGLAAESLILNIGENVGRLSAETTTARPELPWSPMKRMRDLLAHHYEATDHDIVWDTLVADLPAIASALREIVDVIDGPGH